MMTIITTKRDLRNWVDAATSGWVDRGIGDVDAITDGIIQVGDIPAWGTDWSAYLDALSDLERLLPTTALEYANSREHVVVRYASQATPTGVDVAWIPPDTYLPFDLAEVKGVVGPDGSFRATDLVVGLRWRFHDSSGNCVTAVRLRADKKVWLEQHDELVGGS